MTILKPECDAVTDAVGRVVQHLVSYKRGQVCSWEAIESVAGFARYTQHWTAFVKRLKRDFRRHRGVELWAKNGVGLKLLTVEEQNTMVPQKRQQRAGRQLHRGLQALQAIPDDEMSERQRAGRATRLDLLRSSLRKVRLGSRRCVALDRPTASNSPRVRLAPA